MLPDTNLGKYDRIIYTELQKDIVGFSLKPGQDQKEDRKLPRGTRGITIE